MGFDLLTIENAPMLLHSCAELPPSGHWSELGNIDVLALGTEKEAFRFTNLEMHMATNVLDFVKVNVDTACARVRDPVRDQPVEFTRLSALVAGTNEYQIAGTNGAPSKRGSLPEGLTIEMESAALRSAEAEAQRKAGGKAHANTCWKCNDPAKPTKRCGKCGHAKFCSTECQRALWPEHKLRCKPCERVPLRDALQCNAGFLVTPDECEAVAAALAPPQTIRQAMTATKAARTRLVAEYSNALGAPPGMAPIVTELRLEKLLKAFAVYCESAAKLGGFYVW